MEELERLKISLDTKEPHPTPLPAKAEGVVRVSTSMLPEADWSLLRPPTAALSRGNSLPAYEGFSLPSSSAYLQELPSTSQSPQSAAPDSFAMTLPADLILASPSAATRERHMLVAQITPPCTGQQYQRPPKGLQSMSLYDIKLFESTPVMMSTVR